ncbi:hypothetical protein APHAL10511_005608 [Amanita phalloides]|nr:hypothetical protein APHAL10511_005608 [Amanita phalloides]
MDSGGELSYDDSVPYEDRVSLAEHIGSTKVYLLSDATRRKLTDVENDAVEGEEMDTDQGTPLSASTDPSLRPNAIILSCPPIAHLPTARIFDYAAHFDVRPLALEWIDDKTCIFVFPSNSAARSAFVALQKPNSVASPPPPTDATTDARPIPVGL